MIETRTPDAPSHDPKVAAVSAHSTKTFYFKSGSTEPGCNSRARSGMVCKTTPAAQPGTAGCPSCR